MFSWPTCPFCVKAKDFLKDMGADFQAIELDQGTPEGRAIRAELGQVGPACSTSGHRSQVEDRCSGS